MFLRDTNWQDFRIKWGKQTANYEPQLYLLGGAIVNQLFWSLEWQSTSSCSVEI